eukprot:5384976-Amphidinium_carterae.1
MRNDLGVCGFNETPSKVLLFASAMTSVLSGPHNLVMAARPCSISEPSPVTPPALLALHSSGVAHCTAWQPRGPSLTSRASSNDRT